MKLDYLALVIEQLMEYGNKGIKRAWSSTATSSQKLNASYRSLHVKALICSIETNEVRKLLTWEKLNSICTVAARAQAVELTCREEVLSAKLWPHCSDTGQNSWNEKNTSYWRAELHWLPDSRENLNKRMWLIWIKVCPWKSNKCITEERHISILQIYST